MYICINISKYTRATSECNGFQCTYDTVHFEIIIQLIMGIYLFTITIFHKYYHLFGNSQSHKK